MKLTHFGHACVLVETGDSRLLFDPGAYSSGFEALEGIDAVLVTHQHQDHLSVVNIMALLEANPAAAVVADPGSQEVLTEHGVEARAVGAGEVLQLGSATVETVGGLHAEVHPEIPRVPNTGYLVDEGAFLHPGDSFVVPTRPVDVLGLPTGAPWLKVSEAVDFLRAVTPRVAVPIHEALLSRPEVHYRLFEALKPAATTVALAPRGEAVDAGDL